MNSKLLSLFLLSLLVIASLIQVQPQDVHDQKFIWPIDCRLGEDCTRLGFPDIDGDGLAFNGSIAGYKGHQGTDISISWVDMELGVDVFAAADGIVEFVFDGKFDHCPSPHPDCQEPEETGPGSTNGTTVCTELGPYCGTGEGSCYWCFAGANVVVIKHPEQDSFFATRYDHFKKDSITVQPGDEVQQGDVIGQVGSAGKSTGPHLHFEVWGTGYYQLADPWQQELWADDPVDAFVRDDENGTNIRSEVIINGAIFLIATILVVRFIRRRRQESKPVN